MKQNTLLESIYGYSSQHSTYHFKNGNIRDLRKCNVEIFHPYHEIMQTKYSTTTCRYIQGHVKREGKTAGIIKNPVWVVQENGKEYYLMFCEKDTICKLCKDSFEKIQSFEESINDKLTWYLQTNGYIAAHLQENKKILYIHQVIANCHGNGKGTTSLSVDHIDRDPLNNTMENLRVATNEEQQNNKKGVLEGTKRARQSNARELPEGITQDMLPKYVTYNVNKYKTKEGEKKRDYFRIECHPKLRTWESTKSNSVSIQDKLKETIQVLENLDRDIMPEKKNDINLPKYVSITSAHGKQCLSFDKRCQDTGKRMTMKLSLPSSVESENNNISEQVEILNKNIVEKYGNEHAIL
jgi:hypothetical protein